MDATYLGAHQIHGLLQILMPRAYFAHYESMAIGSGHLHKHSNDLNSRLWVHVAAMQGRSQGISVRGAD